MEESGALAPGSGKEASAPRPKREAEEPHGKTVQESNDSVAEEQAVAKECSVEGSVSTFGKAAKVEPPHDSPFEANGTTQGRFGPFLPGQVPDHPEPSFLPQRCDGDMDKVGSATDESRKSGEAVHALQGLVLGKCGLMLGQQLLEVLPLRSQTTGNLDKVALYQLPTSRSCLVSGFPHFECDVIDWVLCMCMSLNSVWGGALHCEDFRNDHQRKCVEQLGQEAKRWCGMRAELEALDWETFFSVRSIDYKGDEVRVARWFKWSNVLPALPREG
eukprot:Skav232358  [mRNA]  locus=scaffold2646:532142:532963:+ [translate_table: standard]